ncbi:MAG: hypothetical protein B6I36_00315 [Desulfobacteraceae bacterium 4572_35.1]|nr:MAG: hypothetical protein B6I36_00315 [Desulfobacteraceae bacterium 4572_35.1]
MQWFAYFIWGALSLCIVAALFSYFYARYFGNRSQKIETDENNADNEQEFAFDDRRWQVLLNSSPFNESEVPEMSQERIKWAGELFGVAPQWFAGGDDPMFDCLTFHNNVGASVEFIRQRMDENKRLRLYAIKPLGVELSETAYDACVVLCFASPVSYGEKAAWRFWPVNVYWEWGYEPEQMQCRQIIYTAMQCGCEVVGLELDLNELYFLLESKLIPEPLYAFSPQPDNTTLAPQWNALSLANAGESVMGQCESTLSADDLNQLIQETGLATGK